MTAGPTRDHTLHALHRVALTAQHNGLGAPWPVVDVAVNGLETGTVRSPTWASIAGALAAAETRPAPVGTPDLPGPERRGRR
jgi:hypothetical protein